MANEYGRHIGENQLVYGMPPKMHASVNLTTGGLAEHGARGEEMKTYWSYHPKPNACDNCKAMEGILFEEYPCPAHRNCKCESEQIATNRDRRPRQTPIILKTIRLLRAIRQQKKEDHPAFPFCKV